MTEQHYRGEYNQRYRYRATASVSRSLVRRTDTGQHDTRGSVQRKRAQRENITLQVESRRMVTLDHQAVKPLSWAERRERFHSAQEERPTRGRLVQRTFAQTGRPAPVGPTRGSKPQLSQHSRPPIPSRGRQRQVRRSFWRKLFGLLVVLIVVTGGISFALINPTFHVQEVHINGVQYQALSYFIQHMGIQGQDIFLLNQPVLKARLETLPLVASASLSIQLPNKVLITIQERTPALLWQNGRQTFGVAQNGIVLAPLSELSGAEYLNVVIDKRASASQVQPGVRFHAADIAFAEQIFQQLPKIPGVTPFALQYVDHIDEGTQSIPANQAGYGSYIVVSAAGWKAYLGDAENSSSLANRLLELQQILLMAQQAQLRLATIDLRFGLYPTYTLKS